MCHIQIPKLLMELKLLLQDLLLKKLQKLQLQNTHERKEIMGTEVPVNRIISVEWSFPVGYILSNLVWDCFYE